MEQIIKRGGQLGLEDIVIGMPHRGRLSVLANVMEKPYRAIFNEFQGGSFKPEDVDGSGDVKYHLGASSDRSFDDNTVHLSLTANPSHLEAVNPVVLGKVRAKQDQKNDEDRTNRRHDAYRCEQPDRLYNRAALQPLQPLPHRHRLDGRSTDFPRQRRRPRRFGHNEGDEPMFTNPVMYKKIKKQKTTLTLYTERLVKDGLIPEGEIEDMKAAFQARLNEEFENGKTYKPNKADWLDGRWSHLDHDKEKNYQRGETAIAKKTLGEIGDALVHAPDGFATHKTIDRLRKAKAEMFKSGEGFDWATAEALAFGSLMLEGYPVRLSGQDCTRGTFSHRHSAFIHQETEERYYPLNNIREGQRHYEVIDSMLSEYAVLGFEYGYSLAEPNALTLWEAQFGDFANGAQIMFDQFISSGESKWLRMSGLVCLLPHGYEGQGPEHSSARLERFLTMCGGDNWIVANCTTPANYFHILRRQLHRSYRKPLIMMTPKSLLRHKLAVSRAEEFTKGSSFHRVLWDDAQQGNSDTKLVADDKIKRVVMCSGKVYFDLLEERDARGINDIYILRYEQFYPFPAQSAVKELERFKNAEMVWCQEEPKNQGAWSFMEPNIEWVLTRINAKHQRPDYVGRAAAASPATGLASQRVG